MWIHTNEQLLTLRGRNLLRIFNIIWLKAPADHVECVLGGRGLRFARGVVVVEQGKKNGCEELRLTIEWRERLKGDALAIKGVVWIEIRLYSDRR